MIDIIVGDEHARHKFLKVYDSIKDRNDVRHIICTGDYFDPYTNVSLDERLENFENIISIAKNDERVCLLLGNHDIHYLIETGETSRADMQNFFKLKDILYDNRECFKIAIQLDDDTVVSHAGISSHWLDANSFHDVNDINERFNEMLLYYGKDVRLTFDKLDNKKAEVTRTAFRFYALDNSGWGDHLLQSPMWIRPNSLLADSQKWICKTQIVGHTRTDIPYLDDYIIDFPHDAEIGSIVEMHPKNDDSKTLILVDTGDYVNYLEREVKE